jgi:hypothetical protein
MAYKLLQSAAKFCNLFYNFAADNHLRINAYSRSAAMLQSFAGIYAYTRLRTRALRACGLIVQKPRNFAARRNFVSRNNGLTAANL